MPTTKVPYQLAIKVSGGTSSVVYVNVRNGRTGDYYKVQTKNNEAVVNLGDLTDNGIPEGTVGAGTHTAWAADDIIQISVSGYRTGYTEHTVVSKATKGGAKISITLTDVSSTNAPAVTIG